jgi:tetratricopeptide (TPR) repeat protein
MRRQGAWLAARGIACAVVCAACLAGASVAFGATPDDCRALRKHGRRADEQKCYASLTTAGDPFTRAEGYWGLEQYEEANNQFRTAVSVSPGNAMIRVRWGRLMHERFNNTEADKLFGEALERDAKNAQAYYGLALVSADGFDSKAIEYTSKALDLDPKLYEAHELLARLMLEDNDQEKAFAEADAALNFCTEALV